MAAALLARLLAGLLAGALAACGTSPATRYFTLEGAALQARTLQGAAPASAMAACTGPPLRVRSVQVPPALDRLEMVREVAPGQIEIREFDHWAAPLPRLARQALAEDLAARLPKDKVVFPGAAWPDGGADLSVDILSFRVADGSAAMQLSWTLRRPAPSQAGTATPAAAGTSPANMATPAPAPAPRGAHVRLQTPATVDAAGTARAFSDALALLADQLAAELCAAPP